MILGEDKWLLFTGRHFWNRKCRKKTWWQQIRKQDGLRCFK